MKESTRRGKVRSAADESQNPNQNQNHLRKVAAIASGMEYRSDGDIRRAFEELTRRERKITTEILVHLVEVEKRKIFAKAGYGSLFDYCSRGLGYSESAAGRRIRAARCIRDYPQVLALLCAGEVTICSISAIAGILNRENQRAILQAIRGKSKRKIDRIVADSRPGAIVRDRIRPVKTRKSGLGAGDSKDRDKDNTSSSGASQKLNETPRGTRLQFPAEKAMSI